MFREIDPLLQGLPGTGDGKDTAKTVVKVRADLGKIGIISASFQPEVRFQKPMTKGKASLHGAGAGVIVLSSAAKGCSESGCAAIKIDFVTVFV